LVDFVFTISKVGGAAWSVVNFFLVEEGVGFGWIRDSFNSDEILFFVVGDESGVVTFESDFGIDIARDFFVIFIFSIFEGVAAGFLCSRNSYFVAAFK